MRTGTVNSPGPSPGMGSSITPALFSTETSQSIRKRHTCTQTPLSTTPTKHGMDSAHRGSTAQPAREGKPLRHLRTLNVLGRGALNPPTIRFCEAQQKDVRNHFIPSFLKDHIAQSAPVEVSRQTDTPQYHPQHTDWRHSPAASPSPGQGSASTIQAGILNTTSPSLPGSLGSFYLPRAYPPATAAPQSSRDFALAHNIRFCPRNTPGLQAGCARAVPHSTPKKQLPRIHPPFNPALQSDGQG